MKATEAQRRNTTTPARESFTSSMLLSAVVHGILFLGVIGGTWLFGASGPSRLSSYTVDLVDAPGTSRVPVQSAGKAERTSAPALVVPPPAKPPAVEPQAAKPAPAKPKPAKPDVASAKAAEPEAPKPSAAKPKPVKPDVVPAKAAKPKAPKPPPAKPKAPKPPPAKPKAPKPQITRTAVSPPAPQRRHKPAVKSAAKRTPERQQTAPQKRTKRPEASSAKHAKPSPRPAPARQATTQRQASTGSSAASPEAEQAQRRAAAQRLAALRAKYGVDGTGGAAAGTGGTSAGTAAALSQVRLRAYQHQVREQIIAAWILPLPRDQARSLQATALFTVDRQGRVSRLRLLEPSGNTLYDESLLRAIQLAAPLPMLPEDYRGAFLEVEIRFRPYDS